MAINDHFRQALVECDVNLVRKIWAHTHPHLPQPGDDAEVITTIHYARTGCKTIEFKHRAYSHCWLRERGMPSALPDRMRPSAERMYPRIVDGVGISVNSSYKPLAVAIRTAMENVVLDAYSCGDQIKRPEKVRLWMQEARARVKRG